MKNTAEMMIFTAEKSLKEYGDKVDASVKQEVEDKLGALRTAKEGTDMEVMKKASEELSGALSKIGEAMQKAEAEKGTEAGAEANPEPKTDEEPPVRDAETK